MYQVEFPGMYEIRYEFLTDNIGRKECFLLPGIVLMLSINVVELLS